MPLWVRTLLVTGPVDEVDRAWPRHLEHLRELRLGGKLLLAGELGRREGLVEVFEARDRLAAEALGRTGALVDEGLVAWTLHPWTELER